MTVEEKKEHHRKLSRDRYYWLKEHHVCVNCGQQTALPGRTLCWDCTDKVAKRGYKKRQRQKSDKVHQEKVKEYRKKIYHERKNAGVCTACGKRPPRPGRTRCSRCADKDNSRYKPVFPPKSERVSYGVCSNCGNPVEPGYKMCLKCLTAIREGIKRRQANPTEKMLANYQRQKRVNSLSFVRRKTGKGVFM